MAGGQCMCITTCLSIHVHLNPWHSGWWSVYVYHYLFINSRTFKPWHSGWWSVYVYYYFFINSRTFKTLTQWFGGQCMCITTCLSIDVHLNPWHSGWWSVYVYHYFFINSRTFKPWHSGWWSVYVYHYFFINSRTFKTLTQRLVGSVCVSLLVYQFTYI